MIAAALLFGLSSSQRGPVDLPPDWPGYASVVRMAREAGLSDLRTHELTGTDAELRVWRGFSLGTSGFSMRRRGGAWRGDRIVWEILGGTNRSRTLLVPLAPPKRGWDALWRELESRGIRTIPDEHSLSDDGVKIYDGTKYLVEVRFGASYRAYYYDNPESHPKRPTALRVAKIARVIAHDLPGAWR